LVLGVPVVPSFAQTPAAKELTAEELDAYWADLAGGDAKKGWVAINALARHPRQSVPLFKERLKPFQPIDEAKVKQYIKDLDSQKFADRQKAETELEKLQELAKPSLEAALAAKPPLEVAKRIDGLLLKLSATLTGGDKLRAIRALEALELIGTPEAVEVLKIVAGGAPEARVTQDAKESIDRLARRQISKP
jgi:hypothetical protein